MTRLNFFPKALQLSILVCLITLLLTGVNQNVIYGQCYSATYSIVIDYTNEDLPLAFKKRLSEAHKNSKKIYKIFLSSSHSFEQDDSIAHICGGGSIMIKPEILIRTIGQESVDFFYYKETEQKCFSVQEPEYMDSWKITGPIPYENTDDRYFKAFKVNSEDYVIFDSNIPVTHNLKLIREIPGLVVEASIGVQRVNLLEFKASSCTDFDDSLKKFQKVDREKVERTDDIDISNFLNPLTDNISSDDFDCVESF